MTPFSLVMAYYENAGMLEHHAKTWWKLPPAIAKALHVVIVDDGSPKAPAEKVARSIDFSFLASFQLYRMGVDVPWNQDACRNLGVTYAPAGWLVLTDMDHVVPHATWRRLMCEPLNARRVYRFGRVSAPDLKPYKQHPNSWAMTNDTFWRIGGYDEALAGNYGTDGDFLVRAKRRCQIEDLPDVLIRYPREVIADASTTSLQRKRVEEKLEINRLIKERAQDPRWRPRHLSFPYERVL